MERLTEKGPGCFEYSLKDHKSVPGEFGTYDAFFDYSMAVKKLGKYEDLEEQGRLVVLPCGEDAELERDGHTFIADHWNHCLTAFRDAPETNSGKQVALFSMVEAEAALKGGDKGNGL